MELELSPALGTVEGSGSFVRFRVSHDLVDDAATFDPEVAPGQGPVWLSLQGFQLDVCCRDADAARRIIQLGGEIFEQARLYTWKEGRWMVLLEGGELLDFPLSCPAGVNLFAGQEAWLQQLVNKKLEQTWQSIERFRASIQEVSLELLDEIEACSLDFGAQPTLRDDDVEVHSYLTQLIEELNGMPAYHVTAASSGRTCIAVESSTGVVERTHCGYQLLEDTSCFDVTQSQALPACKGSTHWFRLEPFFLQVWCRDVTAASALAAAVTTAFKKPGLTSRSGPSFLEIHGAERLEVPLLLPSGAMPYAGREEWLLELANGDLRKTWSKVSQLLSAVQAIPIEAVS